MLDLSKFVEGYLTGVTVYREEKKVCLSLQEVDGKKWLLTAFDVAEFMVLQMCMQNIIDRISIWDAATDVEAYVEKLYSLFTGKLSDNNDMNMPSIEAAVQSIKSGEVFLLELEPVYGAIVLILTKNISFSEGTGAVETFHPDTPPSCFAAARQDGGI